jgi:hypothetical protein
MTARAIRAKRASARIPGHLVCQTSGIARGRLSDIEREYVAARPGELKRINAAIDEMVQTRQRIMKRAPKVGLSLRRTRL